MGRNYKMELVEKIEKIQYVDDIDGLDVLIKPIPDGENEGEMDPRIYPGFRKMGWLSRLLPKSFFKMKADEKSIEKLREVFNKVDSTPIVESQIAKDTFYIESFDGYKLRMTVFGEGDASTPILYFIHGGGFFAGRTEVVEEALKLLVEKTDVIVYSLDYRLAPEYSYPTGHKDTFEGFKWIIREGMGNKDSIFVAGDSAGGNLTQYVVNQALNEGIQGVRGQVLLYPTLNMAEVADAYSEVDFSKFKPLRSQRHGISVALSMLEGSGAMLQELLGVDRTDHVDLSPYVSVNPKLPATLISVGEFDALRGEGIAYGKKLRNEGVDVSVHFYRGLAHAYLDQVGNLPQSEDCVIEIAKFIERNK